MAVNINRLHSAHKGFSIVELLIATAIFSIVLLLCATGVVQVGKLFYKGTIINRTQITAREVSDDISQAIQFGTDSTTFFRSTASTYCLGTLRYTFAAPALSRGTLSGQSAHILWKDRYTGAGCPAVSLASPPAGGQEMLGDAMRLPVFTITQPVDPMTGLPNPAGVWKISVTVAYGAQTNLFTNASYTACIGNNVGGQFCAVSGVTTNAVKRL